MVAHSKTTAAQGIYIKNNFSRNTEVFDKMARIAGVDLPNNKRVEIGITYIYGIGLPTAKKIIKETGINPDTRVKDLSEADVAKLREYIEHHLHVEGDLRSEISLNIKKDLSKSDVIVAFATERTCP